MKEKSLKEEGAKGFSKYYWQENYDCPEEMDGIVNARQHAQYISSFFALEYVDISTLIDFGFGLGYLFEEVLREFVPYRAMGIEPSSFAFQKVSQRGILPAKSTKLSLKKWDLLTWANSVTSPVKKKGSKGSKEGKWYDLGICTSVFQYLSDRELRAVIPVMAKQVKYLYFSAPTGFELERQVKDLEFEDSYALHRTQEEYLSLLRPHFKVIGARMLESSFHFSDETTFFTDFLFRF